MFLYIKKIKKNCFFIKKRKKKKKKCFYFYFYYFTILLFLFLFLFIKYLFDFPKKKKSKIFAQYEFSHWCEFSVKFSQNAKFSH